MSSPVSPPDESKSQRPARGRMSAGKAPPGIPRFFTVDEVAEILNLSPRSVRRLIAEHKLPVHRFGRAVRISEDDRYTFIATRRGR